MNGGRPEERAQTRKPSPAHGVGDKPFEKSVHDDLLQPTLTALACAGTVLGPVSTRGWLLGIPQAFRNRRTQS